MTTVLAFGLLDRANLLLLELLRTRTDAARVLVEQWQHDHATGHCDIFWELEISFYADAMDFNIHVAFLVGGLRGGVGGPGLPDSGGH